jgi:hypothetical protein
VNEGQRNATHCHFCPREIVLKRDGHAWVNGMRICMPCAEGARYRKQFVCKRMLPKSKKKKAA